MLHGPIKKEFAVFEDLLSIQFPSAVRKVLQRKQSYYKSQMSIRLDFTILDFYLLCIYLVPESYDEIANSDSFCLICAIAM